MPTNEEIQQRIWGAIKEKIGALPPCPLCHQKVWSMGGAYLVLPSSKQPRQPTIGGAIYPCVPFFCTHCGNTHILNLMILGFSEQELDSLGKS